MVWLSFSTLRVSSAVRIHLHRLALAVPAILLSNTYSLAQDASSPFTLAQVTTGHMSYQFYCASCHGEDLQGGGDAPPLAGPFFNHNWSKWSVSMLYQFTSQSMPQGLEGELSAETYSNIVSFLLAANGAKPGSTPFDPKSGVKIGDIADGRIATAVINAPVDPQAGPTQ